MDEPYSETLLCFSHAKSAVIHGQRVIILHDTSKRGIISRRDHNKCFIKRCNIGERLSKGIENSNEKIENERESQTSGRIPIIP
jgi:hypothetical protein